MSISACGSVTNVSCDSWGSPIRQVAPVIIQSVCWVIIGVHIIGFWVYCSSCIRIVFVVVADSGRVSEVLEKLMRKSNECFEKFRKKNNRRTCRMSKICIRTCIRTLRTFYKNLIIRTRIRTLRSFSKSLIEPL